MAEKKKLKTENQEKVLGLLKRQGRISSWRLDREYSEGNKRRYLVTVDTDRI